MTQIQTEPSNRETAKTRAADNLLYIAIKYRNALIGVVILLVAIGGGTAFWLNHQKNAETEASMHLSKIAPLLDRNDFRKAIDGSAGNRGLKSISADYGSTPSGRMASLLLANAYYSIGRYDSALAVYKKTSLKDKDLAAAVLAGTGACQAEQKKYGEAAASYEAASEKAENKTLKAHYQANAADNHLDAGNPEKASELYKKTVADYPGSTGAALAQRSLWQMSGNR